MIDNNRIIKWISFIAFIIRILLSYKIKAELIYDCYGVVRLVKVPVKIEMSDYNDSSIGTR